MEQETAKRNAITWGRGLNRIFLIFYIPWVIFALGILPIYIGKSDQDDIAELASKLYSEISSLEQPDVSPYLVTYREEKRKEYNELLERIDAISRDGYFWHTWKSGLADPGALLEALLILLIAFPLLIYIAGFIVFQIIRWVANGFAAN
jgi:hypothetical protein